MRERGQTQYDYLVGITVLLLTLSSVFLFVPGIYQPFEDPVAPTERTATDRLAETLVQQTAVAGMSKTLDYTALEQRLTTDWAGTRDGANVEEFRKVNVSVLDGESSTVLVGSGNSYEANVSAATTVRIVRFENESRCRPVCRLAVRAWSNG